MTEEEKLAWIRRRWAGCPDIYHVPGFTWNGCGPAAWKSKLRRVLDVVGGGVDLAACGDLHDWRYWVGGSEEDRAAADAELSDMILSWLEEVPWWRWIVRARVGVRARGYYMAVRRFGGRHFNYRGGD